MKNQTATKSIKLMDVVNGTTTNSDATPLMIQLKQALENKCKIIVSLEESTPMSSSFLNSSFGVVIDDFGFDYFKENVSIVQCKKSIATRLRSYFSGTRDMLPA